MAGRRKREGGYELDVRGTVPKDVGGRVPVWKDVGVGRW
jgi:hypothetical protein